MITSKDNPHFKRLRQLEKRRIRDAENSYLIEGEREIIRAAKLKTVYFSEPADAIFALKDRNVELVEMAPHLLEKLTVRQGAPLAIAEKLSYCFDDLKDASFVLVLEGIEKPGNLGAILRSADGVGVDGILFADCQIDPYQPNVVRNSIGTLGSMAFVECSAKEALAFVKKKELSVLLATPEAKETYYQKDYRKPCAIVFGSEHAGVSEIWKTAETESMQIPMQGVADSLNVSVAVAIVLFEARRQRDA